MISNPSSTAASAIPYGGACVVGLQPPQSISCLRAIAQYSRGLRADDLPHEVLTKVELCLLDMLACSLEAGDLPWSRQAVALAKDEGAAGPCVVIGNAACLQAAEAAYANGVQAHGLVQEDMHPPSTSHTGVVVLPAAIAVAQAQGSSGAEFVAAVVAGYEAMGRLGRVLVDSRSAKSFRPTGLVGPLGSAIAAARLLGLDEDQTVHAGAFACNGAAGYNEWARAASTEVFFHAGAAAKTGVLAAKLARQGAVGAESTIEGVSGMAAAYGAQERVPLFTQGLGSSPEILCVYYKPAPVCHFAQTPSQVAHQLALEHGIRSGQVEHVDVQVSLAAAQYPGCDNQGPFASVLEAKTSIQFAVASAIIHGAMRDSNFRQIHDAATSALVRRVMVAQDNEYTQASPARQGATVRIRMQDGRTFEASATNVRPLDANGVRERFREVACRKLGRERTEDIERLAANLKGLPHFDTLARLFASPI